MTDKSANLKELEFLINECIDSSLSKPETKCMRSIAELLNKDPSLVTPYSETLKTKLIEIKLPVSQYLLLDLIEYTTCRCGPSLHKEYNSKNFLKAINAVLKSAELTNDVKEKALYVIQFWTRYFKDDELTYKNFPWYYNSIKSMKIPFPEDVESPYERARPFDISRSNNIRESQVDVSEFNKKQLKLFKDLNIVIDSVTVANTMIDEKELVGLADVIIHIEGMEQKLKGLPAKLRKSNEDLLYKYTLAILDDMETTRKRYKLLKDNKDTPVFKSKTRGVIISHKRENDTASNYYRPNFENEFRIPEEKPQIRAESEIIVQKKTQPIKKGFDQIGNYFYPDSSPDKTKSDFESDFLGFDVSNNLGNTSDIKSPANKQPKMAPKDIDLLDLNTITAEQQKEVQNMVKFGIQNNPNHIDLDFTEETDKKDKNKGITSENKNVYVPQDMLKFEKPENKGINGKVEYDPFSDIGEFDLLNNK